MASETFPPAARLRARVEFQAVQQHGRRVTSRYFTVLARPNARDRDRLGIVASRRVGGAVERNRAKRRLRDVFRRQGAERSDARPMDFVVIAKPDLVTAPAGAVWAEFQSALSKLRGSR